MDRWDLLGANLRGRRRESPEGRVNDEKALPDLFHGHNVSYRRDSAGRFYYQFQSGDKACDLKWFTAWQDRFNHFNLNQYCGGDVRPNKQIVRFVRK